MSIGNRKHTPGSPIRKPPVVVGPPVIYPDPIIEPVPEPASIPEPTPIPSTPKPILGLNCHNLKPGHLLFAQSLNINHLRTTIYLPLWETDVIYRNLIVGDVSYCEALGIDLLVVVHNSIGEEPNIGNVPGTAVRHLALIADMTHRLPYVRSWQLYNEINLWGQAPFGAGDGTDPYTIGLNYGNWFLQAYDKLASSEKTIISCGPAAHVSYYPFLSGMRATGAKPDVITLHNYGTWEDAKGKLNAARSLFPSIDLWLTEFGGSYPETQEWLWKETIEGNNRERIADRIYGYCLETDPIQPEHGLRNVDGSDRPITTWLRQVQQ